MSWLDKNDPHWQGRSATLISAALLVVTTIAILVSCQPQEPPVVNVQVSAPSAPASLPAVALDRQQPLSNTWGPERKTFTVESPAPYPVFNSVNDNPNVGDERDFFHIKPFGHSSSEYTSDLAVEIGSRYTVYVYFSNSGGIMPGFEDGPHSEIQGAQVKITSVTNDLGEAVVTAVLSGDNTISVWDSAKLTSDQPFNVVFDMNSAQIHTASLQDVQVDRSIFTDKGAPFGSDALDGNIPGLWAKTGWITADLTIGPA